MRQLDSVGRRTDLRRTKTGMMRLERHGWRELFMRDAARWIVPGTIGDASSLRPRDVALLLFRHPPLRAMAWMRIGGWLRVVGVRGASGYIQRRLLRVYGLEITPGAEVGGGFYIAHPAGCTIRAARIGANVSVIAVVTVGTNKTIDGTLGWPTLGHNVYLGAGCRVLGAVEIGNDVKVGANAVVLEDVADGCTVVGIPAKPVVRHTPRIDDR